MKKEHQYQVQLTWTGNQGTGTSSYRAYSRNHELIAAEKPVIPGSSDPSFRGDPSRYNPEELLVASLSSCHMLWFLHLASADNIIVTAYTDSPVGKMVETTDGGGHFTSVILQPHVTIENEVAHEKLEAIHHRAHALCFIANSVNFEVICQPVVV